MRATRRRISGLPIICSRCSFRFRGCASSSGVTLTRDDLRGVVLIYYFTLDIVSALDAGIQRVLIWLAQSSPTSRAPGLDRLRHSFHWRLICSRRPRLRAASGACRQPVPDLRRADIPLRGTVLALGYKPKLHSLCRNERCACAQPPDEKLSRVFL